MGLGFLRFSNVEGFMHAYKLWFHVDIQELGILLGSMHELVEIQIRKARCYT